MTCLLAVAFLTVATSPETITLVPYYEALHVGYDIGGNLQSWAHDDGDRRSVRYFFLPNIRPTPFCKFTLRFRVPEGFVPQRLEVHAKVGHHSAGRQWMTINAQRADGEWVFTDIYERVYTDGVTVVAMAPGLGQDYVEPDGTVSIAYSIGLAGPRPFLRPIVETEFVNLIAIR